MKGQSSLRSERTSKIRKAFRAAFPVTVPILLGYIPLGVAFGLMMENAGYNIIWSLVSSVAVYSGTAQYIEVSFLQLHTALYEVALITIVMNSRMMFYGLSFLERYAAMGARRWYLIFAMTDETYALLCTERPPADVPEKDFVFAVSFLNQCYWIAGGAIGVLVGAMFDVGTAGVDFVMTALFIVLAMGQWKRYKAHEPAIIGFVSAIAMLALFGPDHFIVPALAMITLLLILRRPQIAAKLAKTAGSASDGNGAQELGWDGAQEPGGNSVQRTNEGREQKSGDGGKPYE
jgi:4-azaleucine resistance transporter AzlC